MKMKYFFPLIALSLSVNASVHTMGQKSLDSFTSIFEKQNIFVATPDVKPKDIQLFLNEFKKFPPALHKEMMRSGAKIHLIHGQGVNDDPTWPREYSDTFDGRAWNGVPGAGGFPFAGEPTRIVINSLNNKHGSSNLVLHEHAHSLDSTYSNFGISSSHTWKKLMADNPQVEEYMNRKCPQRYCTDNEVERFAELFSLYHHSSETREEMEKIVPKIARFFKNLRTAEDLERVGKNY